MMITYKTIFKGRLEFGSARSYEKVLKMYQHRVENYYKSDILFEEEDIFDEASTSLNVPRFITQASVKSWKNTISMLEYVAQFAVAGNMTAWMTENGKILRHGIIEPKSDRSAVQAFLKGRDLLTKKGKEDEAIKSLTKAIEKYDRHAQAYERRGFINFKLKNYDDAIYDFTKSIDYSPSNPQPYLGRGNILKLKKDYAAAIKDFDMAIKTSIPLEPIYWQSRRYKAACHLSLKDYKAALPDLKFFCNRTFKNGDPNVDYKRAMWFDYGKALLQVGEYESAFIAFDTVMNIESGKDRISEADKFLYRGIAREKAGKNGFLKDWKEAQKLGSKKATQLLKRK
ncbi:MAG TPA: tetratricopeptide repeat protein [Phaeodactylibacter sp.]|nr:tetratricopeptide repeat protein [Phaeodactylibacter sp.]